MKIVIEDLEFECIIGILESERTNAQRVIIETHLEYEYKNYVFIDYAKVSECIIRFLKEQKFELLEEALNSLSLQLRKTFPDIYKLYLKITKPDIMKNSIVSLSENYSFL